MSTPKVMGILNITPDSFYDGGRYLDQQSILRQVEKMIGEGADIIDIGGHSTRPGAVEVSESDELDRVCAVILQMSQAFPESVLSVDTFRASVAEAAVHSGASMVNDISGGSLDESMFATIARLGVPYVLMHMRGTPQTMNQFTTYDNLIHEVIAYFHQRIRQLHELGVNDIILDPGFGFAKTVDQNFELLLNLERLQVLGQPILAGLSRKSMIWRTLGTAPEHALNGTTALNNSALERGAKLLRVHDVKEAVECVRLHQKLYSKSIVQ